MQYQNVKNGIFISRPNRFIAVVEIDGREEMVHVKNTGRCRELLLPKSRVVLCPSENKNRKTRYDLIAVYKKGLGLVNIDSQAANQAVKEWLSLQGYDLIRPEYAYGKSRLDFYLEKGKRKILMEVKGCTLEIDGVGYFPDAPTQRGVRHVKELTRAVSEGYECFVVFVIQMPKVNAVYPHAAMDPAFAEAMKKAREAGVKVLCLPCAVSRNRLVVTKERAC